MSFTGLPQLQAAVMARLRANAELQQLVTGIYDEVPVTASEDYIAIDDPFESPDRTFGQNGHESSLVISILTQSPAASKSGRGKAGFMRGLAIAEIVVAELTDLENNPLVVDGHDVVDVDVVSTECFREGDGKTRRVDVTISALLEDQL